MCLSTDKAVYPINAMGISKAMMEKVAQAHARNRGSDGPDRVSHQVRERDVQPWIGHPSLRPAAPRRPAANHHRPDDDPVPHVARGVGRPRRVRLLARRARATSSFARPQRAPSKTLPAPSRRSSGLTTRRSASWAPGTARSCTSRLLSREELQQAEDQVGYFRVPLDARSLEYELFFDEGEQKSQDEDYTSHNTDQTRCAAGETTIANAASDPARAGCSRPFSRGFLMKVLITGGHGFLGWHVACRLTATRGSKRCGWAAKTC